MNIILKHILIKFDCLDFKNMNKIYSYKQFNMYKISTIPNNIV